jgi:hypothetical protein
MAGIKYIRHKNIDLAAWDACIARSCRPLVYAGTTYLNAICNQQWDALVYGDYEAVFPLPVKRKWGIPLIYQPFFCQQLGLFAPEGFSVGYAAFLKAIPRKFLKVRLHLNPAFLLPEFTTQRCNLLLNLNRPYDQIAAGYNADARKNLRKCTEAGIIVETCDDFAAAVSLYREVWGPLNPVLMEQHYQFFYNACRALQMRSEAICLRACLGDEVLAYAIFLRSPQYLHYVCAAPTAAGRKLGVMHAVIDHVTESFAGQNLYLDFEGSEIPDVAAFYRKFGATEERYGVFRR